MLTTPGWSSLTAEAAAPEPAAPAATAPAPAPAAAAMHGAGQLNGVLLGFAAGRVSKINELKASLEGAIEASRRLLFMKIKPPEL